MKTGSLFGVNCHKFDEILQNYTALHQYLPNYMRYCHFYGTFNRLNT